MTDLPGVEIQVWRPKPKPDIRVMKLERGGPLPGGCHLESFKDGWHYDESDEFVWGPHDEVWFTDENSNFSIPWGAWVILDENNNFRGYTWQDRNYERIA